MRSTVRLSAILLGVTLLAAVALLLVGCTDDDAPAPSTTSTTRSDVGSDQPGASTTAGADGPTSSEMTPGAGATGAVADTAAPVDVAAKALTTASGAMAGGRAFDLEIDHVGGRVVFEIKVAGTATGAGAGTEAIVDTSGSEVVSTTPLTVSRNDVERLDRARLDATAALEHATAIEAGAAIRSMEIDTDEGGTVIWELEMTRPGGDKVELDLDAVTGALVGAVRPD